MSLVQEDDVVEIEIEISNSLNENVVPQAGNADSSSLKDNSKSKTSSSSSDTTNKRYLSKFKREWLSNPKYSSFLKECKNDTTRALCTICNIQFSIQNKLKIKLNARYNCSEFYDHLLNNHDLLKQIRSSEKYSHVAKVPRTI